MEVMEMKMLQFAQGTARKYKFRNETILSNMEVGSLQSKLRESRLRWKGYVSRKEGSYVGKVAQQMKVCKRKGA